MTLDLGFGRARRSDPTEWRKDIDLERTVASRDEGEVVGVSFSVEVSMTLPGPVVEQVSAVVGVAVRPTHRRQGRLRSMMRYQLDDLHRRGEALAVLTASEPRIYQRFGYGPATLASWYVVEKEGLEVVAGERSGDGRVSFVDRARAAESFPKLLERYQVTRTGEVSRSAPDWTDVLGVAGEESDRFFVEFSEDGEASGYAAYTIEYEPVPPRRRAVQLAELCALTDTAYVGLWSFVVGIDLVQLIRTSNRPIDEPVRWALSDYGRMKTVRTSEHTYIRLVDVEAALALRRFHSDGELHLEVVDPFCPWNEGVYSLSAASTGTGVAAAEVEKVRPDRVANGGIPMLRLDASALGSIYLGGLLPSALGRVGQIEELTPGALALADRMFVGPEPPFCTTDF